MIRLPDHWRFPALAAGGGLALALAYPPFFLLPGLAGLGVLLLLARAPRRPLLWGWIFGFVHHLATLWWIAIAFESGPEAFRALGIPAMVGLTAVLGLGPALLVALLARFTSRPFALRALVLAAGWVALELLRGQLLRFPWNPLASTLAFAAPALQPVAWFGVYGTDLLLALLAVLPVGVLEARGRLRLVRAGLLALLALVLMLPGLLRRPPAGDEAAGIPVRIVQPNIAQKAKWDPALRRRWLELQLALTRRPAEVPPRLILWPESAVPYVVEDPTLQRILAEALPAGAVLGFGADRFVDGDPPRLTNSFYLLDSSGRLRDRYDKVDLVPFGEFLPFGDLLAPLGLGKLTLGAVDFSPGPGRRTLEAPGIPPLSPLICYEAAFPFRATDGSGRARILVNVTNDAWFGRSAGPWQHFALARMRAVETGLPLLRAANTGISAVIDGYGRVLAMLPLETRGVLDARLPPALTPPPASRWPWGATLVAVLLALAVAMVDLALARRHKGGRAGRVQDHQGADTEATDAASHRYPCRPATP